MAVPNWQKVTQGVAWAGVALAALWAGATYADISFGGSVMGTTGGDEVGGFRDNPSTDQTTGTENGSGTGTGSSTDAGTGTTSSGAAGQGTTTNSQQYSNLGLNTVETVQLNNTMNFDDCHQYNVGPKTKVCYLVPKRGRPADDTCKDNIYMNCIISWDYTFTYWEPSALVEVSCRKGYSMLLPGGVGQVPQNQACVSTGAGGNKRWFFDARVWAINGKDGAARQQAAGSTKRKQSVACGANGPGGGLDQLEGYAKKFKMFSRGGASGPGQSWQAYISDYDSSWAVDGGPSNQQQQPPQQTKCTGTSVENCWGPMQSLTGWVAHPQQPVAAALAGYRAHQKAKGKVSPALSGGYKMNMDYPYVMRTSPFGKSMGLKGSTGSGGGTQGSRCFIPGDPGPWWYTNNQRQDTKPEQLPQVIQQLKHGDAGTGATLHTGVYIFTYWVKTSCELFVGMAGTNVQSAVNGCADKQHY